MPSLSDNDQACNPHFAALVAINIVTQIVQEAENILNTANDSGKSWRYIWLQKKDKEEFRENDEILRIQNIKVDDNDTDNCEIIQNDAVMITSTPQKEIDLDDKTKTFSENGFIGQGDEDIQTRHRPMPFCDRGSPSMLINCLIDMSQVEQVGSIDIFNDVQVDSDSQDYLVNAVAKLVESYVTLALNSACGDVTYSEHNVKTESNEVDSNSSYSLLTDALVSDDTENENVSSFIDNEKSIEDKDQCNNPIPDTLCYGADVKKVTKNDIDLYEKTFLTLNCDDDKYSEEDFTTDLKCFTMQEVKLSPRKSSENNAPYSEPTQIVTKEDDPVTCVKVAGVHKSSLVKRCRLQGAKLMSRLRSWWWKQRLIGRRKGCRSGVCPLSPRARDRAASLLDHRTLRSPSPSRTVAWMFNTVNEALIHSYNMKDFELHTNIVPTKKD